MPPGAPPFPPNGMPPPGMPPPGMLPNAFPPGKLDLRFTNTESLMPIQVVPLSHLVVVLPGQMLNLLSLRIAVTLHPVKMEVHLDPLLLEVLRCTLTG